MIDSTAAQLCLGALVIATVVGVALALTWKLPGAVILNAAEDILLAVIVVVSLPFAAIGLGEVTGRAIAAALNIYGRIA